MTRSVRFAKEAAAASQEDQGPPATTPKNNPPPSSSSLQCPNCGSQEIEQHDASGASICTDCGVVVEENAIVSSVEFVEGAGGSSNMVGQFVSATSTKAYTASGGRAGGRYGFSRDSRETTLANGRRRIQEVASRLRLGSHYVDAAHRLFTIAVEKNFVQGRRTTHVVAACLYIACRQEKSQHMLIDFSDALQVNVYTLGTCFLKFRRLLGLQLEIIDPALYVYRFCAHLDLDDKANAVALTALRLVGRMKRDWIVAGRRPAGICAAALLIAARAHGFSKHAGDVTKILRVCGLTVSSRVKEFESTPSASLTLEQFNTVELEQEADPPVFTKNKMLEARAKAIQENNIQLLTSGALDDPSLGKRSQKWRQRPYGRSVKKKQEFQDLYQNLEQELTTDTSDKRGTVEDSTSPQQEQQQVVLRSQVTTTAQDNHHHNKHMAHMFPKSKFGKALVLPDQATPEELQPSTQPTEERISLQKWKDEMPATTSEEIEDLFRSDEEVAQKAAIFQKLNKDYLVQQAQKETERRSVEAATKNQQEDDAAQAKGHARYLTKTSKKKRHNKQEEEPSTTSTTEEALFAAVSSRKISRKINYDAMSAIFDEDGGFSTSLLEEEGDNDEDKEGQENEEVDPVLAMV